MSPADIQGARDAARKVVETHERLAEVLCAGLTVAEVDRHVAETLSRLQCKSAFLGYRVPRTPPFPSHACLSVNECVVHGTAGYRTEPLVPGDLLSIDIGVKYKGWIGDAAWTYAIEHADETATRLMDAGKESLRLGCEQLRPGKTYLDWARVVQRCVEDDFGFHCIRGLGGHGFGRKLHTPPFISNVIPDHPSEWPDAWMQVRPGQLIAVEPMIGVGTGEIDQAPREWPIFTADRSLSCHYEHDVLITDDGPEILTIGLTNLPDIVGNGTA
ncbi:MAG: type I methionyl aminopeptidase [Phycisphaerales bacterium]|nr:type I methionyl aminopeptidase [Phycisphaerales bacterium]